MVRLRPFLRWHPDRPNCVLTEWKMRRFLNETQRSKKLSLPKLTTSRYSYSHGITPRHSDIVPMKTDSEKFRLTLKPRKLRISMTFRKTLEGPCRSACHLNFKNIHQPIILLAFCLNSSQIKMKVWQKKFYVNAPGNYNNLPFFTGAHFRHSAIPRRTVSSPWTPTSRLPLRRLTFTPSMKISHHILAKLVTGSGHGWTILWSYFLSVLCLLMLVVETGSTSEIDT